jgi:hypothetical protein
MGGQVVKYLAWGYLGSLFAAFLYFSWPHGAIVTAICVATVLAGLSIAVVVERSK